MVFWGNKKKRNLEVGEMGENVAEDFLREEGYKILDKNYRTKYFEIDIIAKKKDVLHFVEVRTKTNEKFGSPEETIDYKKKEKLLRSAKAYTTFNDCKGKYQVDVICIVLDGLGNVDRLNYYQNIDLN